MEMQATGEHGMSHTATHSRHSVSRRLVMSASQPCLGGFRPGFIEPLRARAVKGAASQATPHRRCLASPSDIARYAVDTARLAWNAVVLQRETDGVILRGNLALCNRKGPARTGADGVQPSVAADCVRPPSSPRLMQLCTG